MISLKASATLLKITVALFMIFLIFTFLDRSCTHTKLKLALGELEKQKEVTAAAELRADEAIAREKDTKNLLDTEIRTLTGSIHSRESVIKVKDTKIEDLEREKETLKDAPSIIANLEQQVELWKGRSILTQQTIDELGVPYEVEVSGVMIMKYPPGSVTFNLNEKYEAQFRITDQWKVKYSAQLTLSAERDQALSQCMKDIKGIRFGSKIKTGGVIFAGTAAGATMLGADLKISLISGAVTTLLYLIF